MTGPGQNWLAAAGSLGPGAVLRVHPRGGLTQGEALWALEAQYGPGLYDAAQHGEALRVIRLGRGGPCFDGEVAARRRRLAAAGAAA